MRAAATTYSYDSLNRLTQATYPDGTVLSYTYDAAGNRLTQIGTGYVLPAPPTNEIITPTPGLQVSKANYTITGKAGDNVAVSNVMYQLNNGGWNLATTANGWTNWTAPVTLAPGSNTVSAFATDPSGDVSPTSTVIFDYVVSALLTVNINGGGTVVTNYNGDLLQIGVTYSMTAKTNAGFGFSGWTGSIVTNASKLTFVMASNLMFTANFADVAPPTNAITAPTASQHVSNAVFTVTGKAGDNVAVTNVYCSVNSGGWNNAVTGNNWTNWTAQVTLVPGTNTIAAYAVDSSGNISRTNTVNMVYVLSAMLTVTVGAGGTVVTNYNGDLLQIGVTYSMTAKTNVGFGFSGWTGSIVTNAAKLTFVMASNLMFTASFKDVAPPTNEITAPTANQHVSNAVFTVTGKAGDNVAVTNVYYSVNSGEWSNAVTGNNWTNWTAQVTLVPGTNTIAAYAVDSSGNNSKTNTVNVVYVLSAVLAVSTNGTGTISPIDNGVQLQIGTTYSLTAGQVAGAGFVFSNWTGGTSLPLSVLTNKPALRFTMESNLMLQANFVYTNAPSLSITNPAAVLRVTNSLFTVRGVASDKAGVTGVYRSLNGTAYTLASTGNGWSNWFAAVNLAAGTNTVGVYAVNASNNVSPIKNATIIRVPVAGQFEIATGDNIRHPQAKLAFDGTNYLVVYQVYPPGETNNSTAVGQLVSTNRDLVGSPLALNPGGFDDPPNVAFDGANYLVAWADNSDSPNVVPVRGEFVSPNGLVGFGGQISQSVTVDDFSTIVFGGGVYFLIWSDDRTSPDSVYGVILSTAGSVVASDFLISTNAQRGESVQSSAAFDGTNFLAVWSAGSGNTSINGQFIDPAGNLMGGPFVIYTNSTPAEEALPSVIFDGTKYLVVFHAGANSSNAAAFHVTGRFVTPAGGVLSNNITLTTDKGPQITAGAAFDGERYLVTWNQGLNPFSTATSTNVMINGRFLNAEGAPATPEFTIFSSQGNLIPTWAPVLFDGTQYVLVTGLGHFIVPSPDTQFTNGIISGGIIVP